MMVSSLCYIACGCVFFKQKTAYEMRISDWSSDVCSSDLFHLPRAIGLVQRHAGGFADSLGRHIGNIAMPVLIIGQHLPRDRIDMATDSQKASKGQIGRASCRERVCQYV